MPKTCNEPTRVERLALLTSAPLMIRPTGINMGVLFPLHGTVVYEEAKRAGTLVGDWGLLEDYPWVKLPWIDDVSDRWAEHRRVTRRFWLNPRVLAGAFLASVRGLSLLDYWAAFKEVKSQLLG